MTRPFQLHLVLPGQDTGEAPLVLPGSIDFAGLISANNKSFRRPKLRRIGKVRARIRREARKELVHAAGCVFRFDPEVCATRLLDSVDLASGPIVSVPRSLRARLGRWVGGAALEETSKGDQRG